MRTTLSVSLLCLLSVSSLASAQDTRERARQVVEEAAAHAREGRHALAAERYLDGYALMREAGMHNAPLALWSAGDQLAQIPGREQEAIETIRRFLEESAVLADEAAQVRDWRSNALSLLDVLEARAPRGPSSDLSPPDDDATPTTQSSSGISPVGPIVMGAGGAALLAGVIIGAVSLTQASDFRGACDDLTMCPAALRPQYDEMRAFSAAADVLYVAGGLTAALGLVLTLTITEGSDETPTVSASCTPQGCGAVMQGRF